MTNTLDGADKKPVTGTAAVKKEAVPVCASYIPHNFKKDICNTCFNPKAEHTIEEKKVFSCLLSKKMSE